MTAALLRLETRSSAGSGWQQGAAVGLKKRERLGNPEGNVHQVRERGMAAAEPQGRSVAQGACFQRG